MNPPVFSHGSLRLYLLSLLRDEPRHGYELIQALSDRFGGTYVPSAGTIYPRLAKLEEEGLVAKTVDGRKTVYTITDAGRDELVGREPELSAIEDEVTDSVRRLADELRAGVTQAMKSMKADLASAAQEARREAKANPGGNPHYTVHTAAADPRVVSRQALREADLVINEFRQQLRADLRAEVAHGTLDSTAVDSLRLRLAQVRVETLQQFSR
ncbi:hypothetical protein GCM10022198_13640 [Klugiella xanthotipulae]|uniref:PadR family transcriptional regulator n=1 Tax=Klugiella xanthotipulae TaxID=244735 RepID=A0A543I4H7_9MICO|nr:PadR family transcriptional regulator [Klugiella xanthotipulae]TQM65451.1 PadR family transcriptional regulator [Klugiella xanthotipulae]